MGRIAIELTLSLTAASITTFTALPTANADVNMMEASYQTTFVDLEIGGLKISRQYNSRSNFLGLFGFGWCSTFDTRLEFSTTPQGRVLSAINDCGRLKASDANSLRYQNGVYIQRLQTGLTRTYSGDTGELVSLRGPASLATPDVRILRSRSRLPRDAALGEGLKMRLEFDPLDETVIALDSFDGLALRKRLEFTYSPDRDLLSARNAWSNTYRFHYDTLHNLTRTEYPDQTTELMSYDVDQDRLTSFEGRDSCTETYSHRFSGDKTSRKQTSTSKLVCQNKVKRETRFDFNFTYKKSGWLLSRLSLTREGRTQTTDFITRGTK